MSFKLRAELNLSIPLLSSFIKLILREELSKFSFFGSRTKLYTKLLLGLLILFNWLTGVNLSLFDPYLSLEICLRELLLKKCFFLPEGSKKLIA